MLAIGSLLVGTIGGGLASYLYYSKKQKLAFPLITDNIETRRAFYSNRLNVLEQRKLILIKEMNFNCQREQIKAITIELNIINDEVDTILDFLYLMNDEECNLCHNSANTYSRKGSDAFICSDCIAPAVFEFHAKAHFENIKNKETSNKETKNKETKNKETKNKGQ